MNHNDAIVSITHKSCAALAIQCLADSGITDWQTAFNQQITNAKNLGLMPDDFKVIRETLQNFGLVLQGTATESKGAKNKKEPRIGRWLNHPTFGEGVITEVAVGVLTVDFGEKGFRRLGEDWVHKHCFISEARMDHKCQRIAQKGR